MIPLDNPGGRIHAEAAELMAERDAAEARQPAPGWPQDHMLEAAWGLIANAWHDQPEQWNEAAEHWRDAYHGGPPGEGHGQLAATRTPDGHDLWHEIVAKHGVDRCPTVEGQALWACGELGELAQEIEKQIFAGRGPHQLRDSPEVRKELGDAGLALHGLAIKLGLDLGEMMAAVVRGETRRFT